MKRTMSYLFGMFLAVFGVLAFSSLAHAADTTLGNSSTGNDSQNNVSTDINSSKEINIQNQSTILNTYNLTATTGGNSASNNCGNGSITTGNASATLNSTADLNRINVTASGTSNTDSINLKNSDTGARSTNTIDASLDSSLKVSFHNDANVTNNVNASTSTGNNTADHNALDGIISTGNATVDFTQNDTINSATLDLSGFDGGLTVTGGNSGTGNESENTITLDVLKSVMVDISNESLISNKFELNADSGSNSASDNCGSGSITTGDAMITGDLTEDLNSITFSGMLGNDDSIDLTNDLTGNCSTNNIEAVISPECEVAESIELSNDTNQLNCINGTFSSGCNTADDNAEDGTVAAGDASSDVTVDVTAGIVNGNEISSVNC